MQRLYSFLVYISWYFLQLIAHFKPKIKLFVSGRKKAFAQLKKALKPEDRVIWMHVASLGEFEQGLPILKQLKKHYPKHKLLLTFFSPSGYEVKKNSDAAHIISYLPIDTISNAKRFVAITRPKLALFVKYEIWPNYINELHKAEIPTLLISAIFSKKQVYFKWYGGFMRKILQNFQHLFVQDKTSKHLLNSHGYKAVSISGDTRFDRVSEILQRDNKLQFMEQFKARSKCFVVGSSWPEDEKIIIDFINTSNKKIKYVIAPHNIKKEHINNLKKAITKKTTCYTEIQNSHLDDFEVLIIDTIGLLTKIYSYADIAYVGGGFKTGLHNTLEPAVFGIPILIGPNYSGFKEAEEMVGNGGLLPINSKLEFTTTLSNLLDDEATLLEKGKLNAKYVAKNTGATSLIMTKIEDIL